MFCERIYTYIVNTREISVCVVVHIHNINICIRTLDFTLLLRCFGKLFRNVYLVSKIS